MQAMSWSPPVPMALSESGRTCSMASTDTPTSAATVSNAPAGAAPFDVCASVVNS